jgi:AcrR family transcriptional regulator
VAKRWLERVNAPLEKIAESSGPAPARLERWLRALFVAKYKRVCEDPEMFATYLALAREARDVVKAHKERLVDQIARILSDGVKQGAFHVTDVKTSARAIFDATIRFHHPAHSEEWSDPALAARVDALLTLLLRGLEAPRKR